MKTIKEIVAAFKAAETYETWMDDYQFDERNAVQKAIKGDFVRKITIS